MRRNTESREQWVAFPDAAEATDGQIIVGYTGLPTGLDPDRLQINTTSLERGVIGWGGFASLTLGAYNGDQDAYSMGVGTDSGGNAYGIGSASVAKAESSGINPASDSWHNARDIRNGSLGIQWNINALNSRIKTHEQYDPTIRAKQINREVRRCAMRGVVKHNLGDVISDKPELITAVMGAFDCLFLAPVINNAVRGDFAAAGSNIGVRALMMSTAIRGLRTMFNHGSSFEDQILDPLFWTMRPTRAALGIGTLAASRLVRPAPAGS